MKKFLFAIIASAVVACSPTRDLETNAEVKPIGDFSLGFAVARVAKEVTKGPVSREATVDEWKEALKPALERRLRRFSGDRVYHIGISVEGYVLAKPGIPVVASPKSVLIFHVFVVDDETQEVLNPEPEQLTVIEAFNGGNIIGSGWTRSKEDQLADLAAGAAKMTENWLRKQPWFDGSAAEAAKLAAENAPADDGETDKPTDAETTEAEIVVEETAETDAVPEANE